MADQTTFQPGDVVQLKSGGPTMTVYGIETTKAHCYFFKQDESLANMAFPMTVLKKVEAPRATRSGQSGVVI